MGKSILDKHNSMSNKNVQVTNISPKTQHSSSFNSHSFNQQTKQCTQPEPFETINENEEEEVLPDPVQVANDIDQFITTLSAITDNSSTPPDIPGCVEAFSIIIESRITMYNSGEKERTLEEEVFFIDDVNRISNLTNLLYKFSSNEGMNLSLNRTSLALQHAMAFLEDEFRSLLEDCGNSSDTDNVSSNDYSDRCLLQKEPEAPVEPEYPGYSSETMSKMQKIANIMISAGYETECCNVYSISRRYSIKNQMREMEFEPINMDDATRMPWESLEKEIWRWIKAVKTCSDTVLPGEKKLGESIFSDHPQVFKIQLSSLTRAVVIQLLDFAEATAMVKRSAEKLFKFVDMYEALHNLAISIENETCYHEIVDTVDRIGESAANNFCELENSIKSDMARSPVPGGAVHPLTRYVMNYLEYSCEYKASLEKIFQKHEKSVQIEKKPNDDGVNNFDVAAGTSPFSIQVITVMDLLDMNLEKKSMLYRDPSLRNVFLMNNGRYILQKAKGSNEIRQVMGDTWCRKRSMVVRNYHKTYQRETWTRVLQSLNHEGLLVSGKVNKPLLKERFKIFTTMFDEIHKTQTTWVVSDEQLQSELRISISSVMIPAYRSFVGRFKQYLDGGKQNKYIKYQPEDIEGLIEELFEGNTTSMARRRT